ncbi:MAG: carboxylesterase/lipase family protein [Bacteroidetes bacterium]|nr:carboxylesterase/lipase family protein [Bacteroidota bacterium]
MKVYFIGYLMLCCVGNSQATNDNISSLVVETKQGKIRGGMDKNSCVWRGIKYAEAERFGVPKSVKHWEGVKDVVEFGAIAPQAKSSITPDGLQSEDCLFLNVWSPAPDGKKRPVMFWIHGGGFVIGAGSAPLYHGDNLATNGDVVVVTINYRLGPLGFLYFKDSIYGNNSAENNLGIRDQIAALQWVKENIAAFGGDPDNVTIFGESAGGTSVETLLSVNSAKGLFHRAIAESGPPAIIWSPDIAMSVTKKFCSILGLSPNDVSRLKAIPLDSIKAAEEILLAYLVKETNQKVFSPTIDGNVLTSDIFKCMKPDLANKVDIMLGTNKNEATMFASKKLRMVPRTSQELSKYFNEVTSPQSKEQVIAAYENYPHKSGVLDILTDAVFRIPAIRLAECRSMYSSVYMYRFEWSSFLLNLSGMKSFHGLEIPFVFGNNEGHQGRLLRVIATKKLIARLSGEMQQSWINFARYGNPNGTKTEWWKKYTADDRSTMIFSKHSKLVQDPDAKQRKAWEGVCYY